MSRNTGVAPDASGNAGLSAALADALERLIPSWPDARLCIALSGGVDSVALLHAVRDLASHRVALRLRALHVDHGLQPASGDWAAFCRELCARLAVPCDVLELRLAPRKGESVESEARTERYGALAAALQPGEYLLTAHHADDQLETVLLQLLRGAGVTGLAAMPESAALGAGHHVRPLLRVSRAELLAYAEALGLSWIDDPMNAESRYDRAYLRQQVLPALRARWPSVAQTVGRSARHLGEAKRLLEALAQADGAALVDDQGRLDVPGLRVLPRERQVNVLRWWIAGEGLGVPSEARLGSVLRDVVAARDDARPVVTWRDGEVRRYRGKLYAMRPLGPPPDGGWLRQIKAGETIDLPCGLGRMSLVPSSSAGIVNDPLQEPMVVTFMSRTAACALPREEVREAFRKAAILPWMRDRLPLLGRGNSLLAVGSVVTNPRPARSQGGYSLIVCWENGPRCQ